MNCKRSSAKGKGIQRVKRKFQVELVGVSEVGKREPESVARTSGTTAVSQKITARSDQLGSDSDINVEGVEMKQQQQYGEMARGTGSIPFESNNEEKHKQQVQADADVRQVLNHENQLSITK